MQVTDYDRESAMTPILRQAFRPFFLLGAGFAALSMLLWILVLSGSVVWKPYHNVMFWHQHEMIFGFVVAIVLGFLLTAVQNWTGLRAAHGMSLLVLIVLWLSGRLVLALGGGLPASFVIAVDLALLPVAAFLFGRLVIRVNQTRNLMFIPILLLLMIMNGAMHAGVVYGRFDWIQYGSNGAVWLITLVMIIISGRILPMFTANGTGTPRVPSIRWLEWGTIVSVWLIALIHIFMLNTWLPDQLIAGLFAFAAVFTMVRWLRVKFWITWRIPLLWSLHASIAFIPLAFMLFALRYSGFAWGQGISHSTALHTLTAGAMGVMILAMMARVALGHSGRPLRPNPLMSAAFLAVIIAAVLRIGGGWFLPGASLIWFQWASGLWVIAFFLFCVVYLPILISPRADGRPG